jgi:hypothetical protein
LLPVPIDNKTREERVLEETLFGRDIIRDKTVSVSMTDFLDKIDDEIDVSTRFVL